MDAREVYHFLHARVNDVHPQGPVYQSNFTPKRARRGGMIVDGVR